MNKILVSAATVLMALSLTAATKDQVTTFSRSATVENAPKILVTETPEIKAAFDKLMKESASFRELVYDTFQYVEACPVIPVYAAHLSPDETTDITLHASGKTGCIYLDLNQIQRHQYSLPLVIAAQVKTFHEIFVDHRNNPPAYYSEAVNAQHRNNELTRAIITANRFADRVRLDLGMMPQAVFPNSNL